MISLKTLRWAFTIQKLEKGRVLNVQEPYRRLFSAFSRGPIKSNYTERNPSIYLSRWRTSPHFFKQPFGPIQLKRFASTDVRSPFTPEPPPTSVDPSLMEPPPDFVSSPLDTVTPVEYSPVTEHVGFLKELGLDYGWGPTAILQNLLEHVHIYSGTPWWGSILLTALLFRLALFKVYVNASDVSARMAVVNPSIAPIRARLQTARDVKDVEAMQRIATELRDVYTSAGIQMWRVWVPMIQIPIGFGTFRLMRGMADLPVPGFEDGGLLWITDLTIPDPYFALPVLTGLAFHLTFRMGGELGSSGPMTTSAFRATFLWVLPLVTTTFMMFWPGALQITFAFTSLLALFQARLLRQPGVRNWLGIQPLLKPKSPDTQTKPPYTGTLNKYQAPSSLATDPAPKSAFEAAKSDVKGAVNQVMKSARSLRGTLRGSLRGEPGPQERTGTQRRTPEELRRANAYEEKRRRELEEEKPRSGQHRKQLRRRR